MFVLVIALVVSRYELDQLGKYRVHELETQLTTECLLHL